MIDLDKIFTRQVFFTKQNVYLTLNCLCLLFIFTFFFAFLNIKSVTLEANVNHELTKFDAWIKTSRSKYYTKK